MRARAAAATLMLLVAACRAQPAAERQGDPGDDRIAGLPDAMPDAFALAAAYAGAYPGGEGVVVAGRRLSFTPKRLLAIDGGAAYAVIAEGLDREACPACRGALRVDVVRRVGQGFVPAMPPVRLLVPGRPGGEAPAWEVSRDDRTIDVAGGACRGRWRIAAAAITPVRRAGACPG